MPLDACGVVASLLAPAMLFLPPQAAPGPGPTAPVARSSSLQRSQPRRSVAVERTAAARALLTTKVERRGHFVTTHTSQLPGLPALWLLGGSLLAGMFELAGRGSGMSTRRRYYVRRYYVGDGGPFKGGATLRLAWQSTETLPLWTSPSCNQCSQRLLGTDVVSQGEKQARKADELAKLVQDHCQLIPLPMRTSTLSS